MVHTRRKPYLPLMIQISSGNFKNEELRFEVANLFISEQNNEHARHL